MEISSGTSTGGFLSSVSRLNWNLELLVFVGWGREGNLTKIKTTTKWAYMTPGVGFKPGHIA